MLAQHSRSSKLAFGPFEFDPGSGELFRHGSRVRLASQPGTVLDALVDRPGELVTREDLCNRLWPGATSGDFEHGLNAAVKAFVWRMDDDYQIVGLRRGWASLLNIVPQPDKAISSPAASKTRRCDNMCIWKSTWSAAQ